jgi:hypothetical protein
MKRKIAILLALAGAGAALQAQIPTIDVSSLQQLYAQYRTMQQQLSTAQNIVTTSTQILNQEQNIYNNALGNISMIPNSLNSWLSGFLNVRSAWEQQGNWFSNYTLTPVQSFTNNVGYWANQIGAGGGGVVDMQVCWQNSISSVNNGTANKSEQNIALAGYNAHLVDNARTSQAYGSNIVNQSQTVLSNLSSTNGTLIQQAAAQNTLIYQQTALLDKMKNDINDATVAEAAQRDHELKKQKDAQDVEDAADNANPF